jgi:serine/threonine protein kinase
MRVCNTCGETYSDAASVCAVDGDVLVEHGRDLILSRETVSFSLAAQGAAPAAAAPAGPAHETLEPGVVLGQRYQLIRQIGAGGFGVVYEAEDRRLKKRVAVKVLSEKLGASPASIARFQREAVAATQAGHEGIVLVTDCDVDARGAHFIVMELLEGEDLAQLLKREGPLELARALDLASQIASALSAAHKKGIVHRDLKPRNIFLARTASRKDVVKVLDFGISKMTSIDSAEESLTLVGHVIGTPHYMAPEQADGEWAVDQRADVYALGVILFEMLTHKRPFGGDSVRTLIVQKLAVDAPTLAKAAGRPFAPGIEDMIAHALAREPGRRIASMGDFGKALLRCREAPATVPARPRVRWLALALLPLLGGLGVVLWPRASRNPPPPRPVVSTPPTKDEARITLEESRPPPARQSTVEVLVHVKPSTAVVTVDGAPLAENPLRLPRGSAPRQLRLSAPGHRPVTRTVTTDADQVISVSLRRLERPAQEAPPARPLDGR